MSPEPKEIAIAITGTIYAKLTPEQARIYREFTTTSDTDATADTVKKIDAYNEMIADLIAANDGRRNCDFDDVELIDPINVDV